MPTEERESIGNVKPTGWVSAKYDCVDGKYLYNRCHLIGFQLAGENANEKNLITGTRYLNVTGMLPFENDVADYVQRTDNHVLYRVTPVFVGTELVGRGRRVLQHLRLQRSARGGYRLRHRGEPAGGGRGMKLWEQFDRIVVFDTETTGLDYRRDRIIEIGAVSLEDGVETGGMDLFIRLPEGRRLDPFIVNLTGITEERLETEGVGDEEAARAFADLLEGAERPLIVAYNAQFDLNFLYGLLRPWGLGEVLKKPRFLDALTVYKDRRDYPHKLENAIAAYGLEDKAVNSHRAIDDARAAALALEAMAAERDDLERYVDLFGAHPKYGVSGRRISSVTYRAQPYERVRPLYELA